jgi:PAS domain-containing protein
VASSLADMPPACRAQALRVYEAADTQTIIHVEDVYSPTDTWFSLRIHPSEADVAVYFHETTERNQSAQDRQRHEQRTQLQASLIELAYDAIIVRDPASTIVSWNRGAEHLYGWTAQEAISLPSQAPGLARFPPRALGYCCSVGIFALTVFFQVL